LAVFSGGWAVLGSWAEAHGCKLAGESPCLLFITTHYGPMVSTFGSFLLRLAWPLLLL